MKKKQAASGQNFKCICSFYSEKQQVKKRGRPFLRLDCEAGNGRLPRYYEAQGFTYQGTITDQDYMAALYEKPI